MFDLLGIVLAGGNEGGEGGSLFCGQSNFVNLAHSLAGVEVTKWKDRKGLRLRVLGRVYTAFALFSGLLRFFVTNLDKIHNAFVAKVLIFKTD